MGPVTLAPERRRVRHDSERYAARVKSIARKYRKKVPTELRAASVQLGYTLGFVDIDAVDNPDLRSYIGKAADYQEFALRWLSEHVGRGNCGPIPASVVASASLQLAASRFAFEKLHDLRLFSRLADSSARNLVLAHELCAREAALKPTEGPHALLAALVPEYSRGNPDAAGAPKWQKSGKPGRGAAKTAEQGAESNRVAIEAVGEPVLEGADLLPPGEGATPAEGGTPSIATSLPHR